MAPTDSRDAVVGCDFHARCAQTGDKCIVIAAAQGRVRFPGSAKVGFDTKVDLYSSACEPASAALRQFRRFWHFSHAEDGAIERSRRVFSSNRHGELHVIDSNERAGGHDRILSAGGSQIRRCYRLPTIPRTDSISFAES